MDSNELNNLREAIQASPNNMPLRKMYANALLKNGQFPEAEIAYKEALRMSPNDINLKLGLIESFHEQSKTSLGLVIIEEITKEATPPAKAWLLYAKLLLQSGNAFEAKHTYEKAILIDNQLKDSFLESEINLAQGTSFNPEPERIKMGAGDANDSDNDDKYLDVERPKIKFSDVGGMDKVKEEIRMKIIFPLQHPEIYKAYGKKIGGGIMMYGPPGCGKTHLARATAGEVNANFITVGISDVLDMWMGASERNLHAIFEKARSLKPCVLFFDEVDALGASRTDMKQSAGRHLINQFLSELDGVDDRQNDGVLVLAATNAPWHVDPAFRRPGRFDRIIFVPPPDDEARASILDIKLKGKPVKEVNFNKVGKKTTGFSGADIEALIDMAIESKMEASMKAGRPIPLETNDLLQAAKSHKPTTSEWFQTAKNYALFANESGLYDDILSYLKIK